LALARENGDERSVNERLAHFLTIDAQLIQSPDSGFRFHSGVPA
jgi:tRNA-(ms[2]io[6]A)-hydroxylase